MSANVFLSDATGGLQAMDLQDFRSEATLDGCLTRRPELLGAALSRKVVGQAIEYAANIVDGMTGDEIGQRFRARIEKDGGAADEVLASFLNPASDAEPDVDQDEAEGGDMETILGADFWQKVDRKRQATHREVGETGKGGE